MRSWRCTSAVGDGCALIVCVPPVVLCYVNRSWSRRSRRLGRTAAKRQQLLVRVPVIRCSKVVGSVGSHSPLFVNQPLQTLRSLGRLAQCGPTRRKEETRRRNPTRQHCLSSPGWFASWLQKASRLRKQQQPARQRACVRGQQRPLVGEGPAVVTRRRRVRKTRLQEEPRAVAAAAPRANVRQRRRSPWTRMVKRKSAALRTRRRPRDVGKREAAVLLVEAARETAGEALLASRRKVAPRAPRRTAVAVAA